MLENCTVISSSLIIESNNRVELHREQRDLITSDEDTEKIGRNRRIVRPSVYSSRFDFHRSESHDRGRNNGAKRRRKSGVSFINRIQSLHVGEMAKSIINSIGMGPIVARF